jgi:hypothetical protein
MNLYVVFFLKYHYREMFNLSYPYIIYNFHNVHIAQYIFHWTLHIQLHLDSL